MCTQLYKWSNRARAALFIPSVSAHIVINLICADTEAGKRKSFRSTENRKKSLQTNKCFKKKINLKNGRDEDVKTGETAGDKEGGFRGFEKRR